MLPKFSHMVLCLLLNEGLPLALLIEGLLCFMHNGLLSLNQRILGSRLEIFPLMGNMLLGLLLNTQLCLSGISGLRVHPSLCGLNCLLSLGQLALDLGLGPGLGLSHFNSGHVTCLGLEVGCSSGKSLLLVFNRTCGPLMHSPEVGLKSMNFLGHFCFHRGHHRCLVGTLSGAGWAPLLCSEGLVGCLVGTSTRVVPSRWRTSLIVMLCGDSTVVNCRGYCGAVGNSL